MSCVMRKLNIFLIFATAALIPIASIYVCFAWPSSEFHAEGDDIFDIWHVCRTNGFGEDGFFGLEESETEVWFRPLIAFESLGEYTDTAYRMGEQFVDKYPDHHQRAEKVFEHVRDTVQYLNDIDQFDRDEYALNADEVANIIQTEGIAYGDCEEFATTLAVMYQGAGFRSAIVICPGHAAVLVYLPDYGKENVPWRLKGEPGWVWAEATGNTNRFGWTPVDQIEEPILAYEITSDEHLPLWDWEAPDEEELPPKPDEEELPPKPDEEELPPKPDEEELPPKPPVPPSSYTLFKAILPAVLFILTITGIIILVRKRRRRARAQ